MDKSNFSKLMGLINSMSESQKEEMPHIILVASKNEEEEYSAFRSVVGGSQHLLALLISTYRKYPQFRTIVKESLNLYPEIVDKLNKKKQLN